jgi:hypothetical protein
MSNSTKARRRLNPNAVNFARQVEQKKTDLAKQFVKDRVEKDAKFAHDVLKVLGDLLPEDIKKLAHQTIAADESHGYVFPSKEDIQKEMDTKGLKPFAPDGGCSMVDVPKEELLKSLEISSEKQKQRLDEAFSNENIKKTIALYEKSRMGVITESEFTETPCEPLEEQNKGCCGGHCGCHDDKLVLENALKKSHF